MHGMLSSVGAKWSAINFQNTKRTACTGARIMIFNAGGLAAKVKTGWSLNSKGSPPGLSKSALLTSTLPNDHKIIDMCVYIRVLCM